MEGECPNCGYCPNCGRGGFGNPNKPWWDNGPHWEDVDDFLFRNEWEPEEDMALNYLSRVHDTSSSLPDAPNY